MLTTDELFQKYTTPKKALTCSRKIAIKFISTTMAYRSKLPPEEETKIFEGLQTRCNNELGNIFYFFTHQDVDVIDD